MTIRKMRTSDLPAVARLCGQLGYPSSLERVTQRFAALKGRTGEHMLVGVAEGAVRGWIHVRPGRGQSPERAAASVVPEL